MEVSPISYFPKLIPDHEEFYTRLLNSVPWMEWKWGKAQKPLPRLVYRYGVLLRVPVLDELKAMVEALLETKVQGVWCNYYRNGEDYTPYHQDDYGDHVFSLSFGEGRDFFIRPSGLASERQTFHLESGDGFYFSPEINKTHEHSVPKRKRCEEGRISVVFFISKPYSA